jgi:hypothetical protein
MSVFDTPGVRSAPTPPMVPDSPSVAAPTRCGAGRRYAVRAATNVIAATPHRSPSPYCPFAPTIPSGRPPPVADLPPPGPASLEPCPRPLPVLVPALSPIAPAPNTS